MAQWGDVFEIVYREAPHVTTVPTVDRNSSHWDEVVQLFFKEVRITLVWLFLSLPGELTFALSQFQHTRVAFRSGVKLRIRQDLAPTASASETVWQQSIIAAIEKQITAAADSAVAFTWADLSDDARRYFLHCHGNALLPDVQVVMAERYQLDEAFINSMRREKRPRTPEHAAANDAEAEAVAATSRSANRRNGSTR